MPILPVENRLKKLGNAGIGTAPAENHVLLLEDEPSHCRRHGLVWKLQEITINRHAGFIIARRESKAGDGQAHEETLTFDAATRIWRGRERLGAQQPPFSPIRSGPKAASKPFRQKQFPSSNRLHSAAAR